MEKPRNEFKHVKIESISFLYPIPVIKEKKYLIEVEERFADFFITAFAKKYLPLPDENEDVFPFHRFHVDEKTKIRTINYRLIDLHFLRNEQVDEEKARRIQQIINQKLINYLSSEDGSQYSLKKAIENQKKCHVCLSLGLDFSIFDHLNL